MSPGDNLKEWGRTLIYAVLIAVVFRIFLFQPFSIPSSSMEPTLLVGDYLFVNKFTYGYRFRLPKALDFEEDVTPEQKQRQFALIEVFASGPERGDVVVFKKPSDGSTDYIKRVIGMPGDIVETRRGRLYINNELIPRSQTGSLEAIVTRSCPNAETPIYTEVLPGGVEHIIKEECLDRHPNDDRGPYRVPEGHYMMLGDNRDNSTDSRSADLGFVPVEYIVGRAEVIFFSLDEDTRIWEFWRWPFSLRYGRLAMGIQ